MSRDDRGKSGWIVTAIAGMTIIAGLIAAHRLPVLTDPEEIVPWIETSLLVPGLSAEAVDRWTAGRIEEVVRSVEGVCTLETLSLPGRLSVMARCRRSVDLGVIRSVMADRLRIYCDGEGRQHGVTVDRVSAGLHGGRSVVGDVLRIGVWKQAGGAPPGMTVRGVILPALLSAHGVASIDLDGDDQKEILVVPRMEAVVKYGITSARIASSIMDQVTAEHGNADPVAGTDASSMDPARIPLLLQGTGSSVRLGSCAMIRERLVLPPVVWRIDGRPAVVLTVHRKPETDLLGLETRVRAALDGCRRRVGPDIVWEIFEDPSGGLRKDLGAFLRLAMLCLLTTALAGGWLARSWRASIIAAAIQLTALSGAALALTIAGKAVDPATIGGGTLGLVCILPGMRRVLCGMHDSRGDPGACVAFAGVAAGVALMVSPGFLTTSPEASMVPADAGFAMTAVCGAGLLAFRGAASLSDGGDSAGCPTIVLRLFSNVAAWCRGRKGLVLTIAAALFGLPLWLIPRDLPRDHPLFRLHLVTFGSQVYREHRVLVERLCGGIVYLALSNLVRGEADPHRGRSVVIAALELPSGCLPEATAAATSVLERRAVGLAAGRARVTTMIAGSTGTVRVEFRVGGQELAGRVSETLKAAAAGIGNARVTVLGSGPGFQMGQTTLPAVAVELRGFDRMELLQVAWRFREFLEREGRVRDVEICGPGGAPDGRDEIVAAIDPARIGDLTPAGVARCLMENLSRSWIVERGGTPVHLRIETSFGDSSRPLVRVQGGVGAARCMSDLVTIRSRVAASSVVRDQREYVQNIRCLFDGPEEIAKEFLSDVCGRFRLPPGYRFALQGEFDAAGDTRVDAILCAISLCVAVLTLVAGSNVWTPVARVLVAMPAAGLGACCAVILLPVGAGGWTVCACGVVVISGVSAAMSSGVAENFGNALMVLAGLIPMALIPPVAGLTVAFHAAPFALWSAVGTAICLVVVPVAFSVVDPA